MKSGKVLVRRVAWALLAGALSVMCIPASAQLALPYDPRAGVVKILAESSDGGEDVGAGVVIGYDPEERLVMIVTAAHVIQGADKVEAVFFNKRWVKYPAKVFDNVLYDLDIAMLIVHLERSVSILEKLPRFAVGETRELQAGSDVLAIGHPLNSEWQAAQNRILRPRDPEDRRKLTFTKLGVDRGNSGGPLLNAEGAVIGIVSKKGPNYAVAVRIEVVIEILHEDWQVPLTFLGSQQELEIVPAPAPEVESLADAEAETEPGAEPETGTEVDAEPGAERAAAGSVKKSQVVWDGHGFNYLPQAVADAAVTSEDVGIQIEILANDSDEDEDPLSLVSVDAESKAGGSVGHDGSIVMYMPPPDFHGADSFEYSISDNRGGSDTATVTIAVAPVNDDPELTPMDLKVHEGETLDVRVAASDPDDDPLTFSAQGLPGGATLHPETGQLVYTPTFAASAPDTPAVHPFELTVDDGQGGLSRNTSKLTVLDVPGGLDPGTGVKVVLTDGQPGAHPVSLELDQVTSPGVANATFTPDGTLLPPSGYRLSGNSYLDLSSTAQATGALRICVDTTGRPVDQVALTFQQWTRAGELTGGGGSCGEQPGCWQEITDHASSQIGRICGITEQLGRVALLERLGASVSSQVLRRGARFQAQIPLADTASLDGASWDWGDKTTSPAVIDGDSVAGDHQYAATGLYQVSVTLTGASGTVGSAALGPIAVYDSAAGAVKGSGTFTAPSSATRSGTGRFKLNSEYKSGADRPSGRATLTLDSADLKFKGDTQSWLVVTGGSVAVHGQGKVNNSGGYDYLITATTGGGAAKIRARIRKQTSGEVVFDTQPGDPVDAPPTTSITSGQIRITR